MEGLIEEAKELLQEDAEEEALDAGLIACAQRVEHYEIAGYGCVRTYAELLGEAEIARMLQETLDEEGATDKALTELAKQINVDAEAPAEEEDAEPHTGPAKTKSKKRRATAGAK